MTDPGIEAARSGRTPVSPARPSWRWPWRRATASVGLVLAITQLAVPRAALGQAGPPAGAVGHHPCASATERCDGEIRVPLDWSDPDAERITVAFAWIPRADATRPATGTILANFGGPSPALPVVPVFQHILGPVLERQNLLVVEPRGMGKSSPLRCPGLARDDGPAIAACAEALGPRVQYFTTDQVVADMDAVREALGIERVSFYGNSYGTVFAHAYATRFPERTAAVYFDSVVRIDEDGYLNDPGHSRLDTVELVCARSAACGTVHASPAETVERLIAELRAHPDPAVPVGAVRPLLQGANIVGIREVAAAAAAYLAGDRAPLHRLTSGYDPDAFSAATDPDLPGALAIYCGDSRFAFDRDAAPEDRRRQLGRFYATEKPLAPFDVGEIDGFIDWTEPCIHWPTPRESPPVPADVRYPSIPVLAAAGDFDSNPPAVVAEQIEHFPRSTLLSVRYGAHALALGPWPYSQCVREAVRDFFTDPRHPAPAPAEPDGCDAENFRAVGRFPLTVAEVPPAESNTLSAAERRLIAAAFATAADAIARRNPFDRAALMRPAAQAGLRGGEVRWDDESGTINFDEARFVEDLAVTGTVHMDAEHHAVAELRAAVPDGRTRELVLRWRAFEAEDRTEVVGRLDGAKFAATVPRH